MTTKNDTPKVYAAIAGVMADIAKEGIAKGRSNQQQGYKFRGIDDVYNALSPILSAHGLVMLPRVLSRELVERKNQKGTALFYVTVDMEFTLVCAEDGSAHVVKTYGEAMDSGDKATNKAMSAAYKYAAMQAFCIPTEGDNDADSTTHEVVANDPPKPKTPNLSVHPEGKDWWGCDGYGLTANQAKKDGLGERFEEMRAELSAITGGPEWRDWCRQNTDEIRPLPQGWRIELREHAEAVARDLGIDLNAREAA